MHRPEEGENLQTTGYHGKFGVVMKPKGAIEEFSGQYRMCK